MRARRNIFRLFTFVLVLLVGWGLVVISQPELPPLPRATPTVGGSPFVWQTPPGSRYNPFSPVPPSTGSPVLIPSTPQPGAGLFGYPSATTTIALSDADVTFVYARQEVDDTWTFRVTVSHTDTSLTDYVDGWDVVLPDGVVLKPDPTAAFTLPLDYPQVGARSVTHEQTGLLIPPDVKMVVVRAHDKLTGYGGKIVLVKLDKAMGPNYEVER